MTLAFPNTDIQLTSSGTSVLFCPANASMVITKATVCNTDSSGHTVDMWRIPSGGSSGTDNQILDAYPVAAGGTVTLPINGQSLNNMQSFFAAADVSSEVTLSITAIQQS